MNCAEGEWWDEFVSMWGDTFGRTEAHEAEINGCTLEEWREICAEEANAVDEEEAAIAAAERG